MNSSVVGSYVGGISVVSVIIEFCNDSPVPVFIVLFCSYNHLYPVNYHHYTSDIKLIQSVKATKYYTFFCEVQKMNYV